MRREAVLRCTRPFDAAFANALEAMWRLSAAALASPLSADVSTLRAKVRTRAFAEWFATCRLLDCRCRLIADGWFATNEPPEDDARGRYQDDP